MENSASSNNATEILKPVKKRKRKDYQSPSEEEYESEQMVGRVQGGDVCAHADVKGGTWDTLVCTECACSSHWCFSVLCRLYVKRVTTCRLLIPKRLECVEH